MGKLRDLSGLDICRILEQNGFAAIRQRGSHRIMQERVSGTTVTVPFRYMIQFVVAHCKASFGNPNSLDRYLRLKVRNLWAGDKLRSSGRD